jgi:ureidoacrylate peracid hydrolase
MIPLEQKVDPRSAALIVVDVQNDFCHEEGASAKNAKEPGDDLPRTFVPRLVHFIDEARRVGMPVIFIQTTHSPATDSEAWDERHEGRRHYVCLDGSWGAEFYGVKPLPGETIVNKHRYSAFTGTNLDEILRSLGRRSVIVTGIVTGVCVESTAREAFWRDYLAVVNSDCCGASSVTGHQEALDRMERSFAAVATTEQIIACWAMSNVPAH